MPFTDDDWRYPELNIGEPYREAWPTNLQAPRDMYEVAHGMYCVREATVAIIATIGKYRVEGIWVTTPTQRGTTKLHDGEILTGMRTVRFLMAPRPAVTRYMTSVGQGHPRTMASIDGVFSGDDDSVRALMGLNDQDAAAGMAAINASDLGQLQAEAARLVKQQWPAIMTLAQALADARGQMEGTALAEAITAALQTTTGRPR